MLCSKTLDLPEPRSPRSTNTENPSPVNPSAEATGGQSLRRASDVFSGAMVKRKLVAEVLASIKQTVTAHETFAEGNLISNRERGEWSIPAGKTVRTPPSWGHPSSRHFGGEAARRREPTSWIDFR